METPLAAFRSGLESIRADAADVAMAAPWIVKRFDVFGNVNGRHLASSVDPLLDSFFLEAGKEGLRNGIVPTVAPSTHAGLEAVLLAEATPVVTAVLTSLIRVNDCSVRSTALDSHHHSIQHEPPVYGRSRRPPDNLTREQIHDDGQVQPALPGADIGNICGPDPVWLLDVELPLYEIWNED